MRNARIIYFNKTDIFLHAVGCTFIGTLGALLAWHFLPPLKAEPLGIFASGVWVFVLATTGFGLFEFIRLFSRPKAALYIGERALVIAPFSRQKITIPWRTIKHIYFIEPTHIHQTASPSELWVKISNPKTVFKRTKSFILRRKMAFSFNVNHTLIVLKDVFDIPLQKLHARLLGEIALHKETNESLFPPDEEYIQELHLPQDLPPFYNKDEGETFPLDSLKIDIID